MIVDQTLPKSSRILKSAEFQLVYKKGLWVGNREIVVNFTRHQKPFSKFGITVSKKVSKKAVDRNRIKRHFREWFRKNKHSFHSIDMILTAKPSINVKSTLEIEKSLEDVWRKVQKKC